MFSITYPWVFLLLPLPVLAYILLPERIIWPQRALQLPFAQYFLQGGSSAKSAAGRKQYQALAALFLLWTVLLCALAAPRWVGEPLSLTREGRSIFLALDLSGSMEINDMVVQGKRLTRLDIVKEAAADFIQKRTDDKLGLILFGAQAYLQTPLTFDKRNLLDRIEEANVGLAGKTTSIGDAIGLAVKRLQQTQAKGRVLILLTDGANNSGVLSPDKAAELARDEDIKIYTIGLGSESSLNSVSDIFMGLNAQADLDEDSLKKIAKITGGRYFRATNKSSLQAIYETINALETEQQSRPEVRVEEHYYPYFLVLYAFIIVMYLVLMWRPNLAARFSFLQKQDGGVS